MAVLCCALCSDRYFGLIVGVCAGEKNLIDADSDQNAARKRQCCIVVIVVVALLVIVGPVILKTVNVL
jgi:hypothetical protein